MPSFLDPAIPVADAQFSKSGNGRDFWTERLDARDERIALTWYKMGDPFLVHTQPNSVPGRPYGICTVLIPALGARLTRNGIEAEGRPWPRDREGRPSSTCVLGLCESWTAGQIGDPGEGVPSREGPRVRGLPAGREMGSNPVPRGGDGCRVPGPTSPGRGMLEHAGGTAGPEIALLTGGYEMSRVRRPI